MGFLDKYKNALLFILVFAILGGGYWFLFGDSSSDDLLISEGPDGGTTAAGLDLLALSARIRSIELDNSIFEDPAFKALRDFGQDLVPEPKGRRNPFAPIGSRDVATPVEAGQ